jgi:predicted aspartyl protease
MMGLPIITFLIGYSLFSNSADNARLKEGNNVIPFVLHDNRIFVKARIKGVECQLIVDTGGNSNTILDEALARRLNLSLKNGRKVYGAGEKAVPSYSSHVDSISISDLTLRDQILTIISFQEMRSALNMQYLDGLVGSEVFHQFAVEIDYKNGNLILHNPNEYKPHPQVQKVPFDLLYGNIPVVDGTIDEIPGKLVVDTGDRSEFTVFSRFASQHKFFNQYKLSDTLMTGYGIGGPIMGRFLTIRSVSINNAITVEGVKARIPTIVGGAFDRNDDIVASIGNGMLKRFSSVTFDYKRQSMDIVK